MAIIHILNVADLFFMAAGVGAALLMIVVSGLGEKGGTHGAARKPEQPRRKRT